MPTSRQLELIIRAQNQSGAAFKAINAAMKGMKKRGNTVTRALNTGFRVLKKTISAVASAFKAAIKLMILPLAVLGTGFILAIRQAGSFEQSMANVASVLGANKETLQSLSDAAREMGKTSVFSAQEAARAMYDLASAGFSADQIMDSLKGTMLLAAATASDLTFTTETVTSAIKQFGLQAGDADRVANSFAASISFSKLNMDRLSTAMSFAGPVAAAFGHTMEGTLSVLAQFANLGLRASMVGTTFRQGMLQLQRSMPTDQIEKGADVLKRLGIQFKDIDPSVNSVAQIVGVLHGKVTQMSEAVALFGVRAGGPFLKLIKAGAAPLIEFEKKITGTRKAFEMSEIQITTFYGSLRLFKSAIQEAQISLGTAFLPAMVKIVDTFTKWVNIINKIDWSEWWSGFKSNADLGVQQLNAVVDLFRAGGAFRVALTEWGKYFVSVISAIAKIIWIPLETEFSIIIKRMGTTLKTELGDIIFTIGTALGRLLGGGKLQIAGANLISQAGISAKGAREGEPAFRAQQAARQSQAFQGLMGTSPTQAAGLTSGAFAKFSLALTSPMQTTQATEKAAEEEKKQVQLFTKTIIDSNGKMVQIFTDSATKLQNQIRAIKTQVGQLDANMKRSIASNESEIGAFN